MTESKYKPFTPGGGVYILSSSSVVGHEERRGPLGSLFDTADCADDTFGMESWEQAEAEMQRLALSGAFAGTEFSEHDIGYMFSGDLLNQCVGSGYGLIGFDIPFLGLYGACSTCAEGLLMSAITCSATGERCAAVASSHNCSAERQFRSPVEYGGQRTPTSQWTVTGSAAFIIGPRGEETKDDGARVKIADVMPGIVLDKGITDINNMGAAMAPAAADTLLRYFRTTDTCADDYDLIVTGDLGREGAEILCELCVSEGYDISEKHKDCGLMIYAPDSDKHAGGSGCGCSAVVCEAYVIPEIRRGALGNVLFVGTGALMNPTMLYQGMSIPAVAHLVHFCGEDCL